eukprot:403356834
MNKDQPQANRVLSEKWTRKQNETHKRSLSNTRPVLKLLEPESLKAHPKGNLKREQLKIVRDIEIDHENQNLIRRIAEYKQKNGTQIFQPNKTLFLPGIQAPTNHSISYIGKNEYTYAPKSLNWTKRKFEYQRIDQENKELLERMKIQRSQYNVKKLKVEFNQALNYKRNITHHNISSKNNRIQNSSRNSQCDLSTDQPESSFVVKKQYALKPNNYLKTLEQSDYIDHTIQKELSNNQSSSMIEEEIKSLLTPSDNNNRIKQKTSPIIQKSGQIKVVKPIRFQNFQNNTNRLNLSQQALIKEEETEDIGNLEPKLTKNNFFAVQPNNDNDLMNLNLSAYNFNNQSPNKQKRSNFKKVDAKNAVGKWSFI